MKQWISLLLTVLLLCTPAAALEQPSEEELSIGAPAAILIERETGTVLRQHQRVRHGRQPDLAQGGRTDDRRRDDQMHRRELRQ